MNLFLVAAMKQYNGVPLDGRPMSIQIATSEVNGAATSPLRRVGSGGGGRVEKPKRGGSGTGGRYGPKEDLDWSKK